MSNNEKNKSINSNSPLFSESLVYKPFKYPKAIEIDKQHEQMHWLEEEVPMTDDVSQWKGGIITNDEKAFVTNVFNLFTTTDVMVGKFYIDFLIPVIKNNEVRNMLIGFANREKTHQRAYALLNDTLGLPDEIYSSFLNFAEMKDKVEFAMEADTNSVRGLALGLSKDMFNEGISLFSSFAMLLNFKRFGKLTGMAKILDWSLLDESLTLSTEVLTKNGWTTIDKITEGDEILQWDMETQESSFQQVHTIKDVKRDYSYVYESETINQNVSGGHRMIIEQDGFITESTGDSLDVTDNFNFITSGIKTDGKNINIDNIKNKIIECVNKDESLDWIYEIIPDMTSETAFEILNFYSTL